MSENQIIWLSISEASIKYNVTPKTIHRWIEKDMVESKKENSFRFVNQTSFEKFLKIRPRAGRPMQKKKTKQPVVAFNLQTPLAEIKTDEKQALIPVVLISKDMAKELLIGLFNG